MASGSFRPNARPAGERATGRGTRKAPRPLSKGSKIALVVFAAVLVLLVIRGGWAWAVGLAGIVLIPTGIWQVLSGRSWFPSVFPAYRVRGRMTGLVLVLAGLLMSSFTSLLVDPVDSGTEAAAESSASSSPTPTPSPTSSRSPSLSPTPEPTIPAPEPTTPSPSADGVSALAVLGTLEVKGRAPKTGYARDQFGQRWADVDRNGCDTRNDTLGRDLTDKTFKPGTRDCVVLSGTLADPFTATLISFVRGEHTSNAVQIDHVVALSDAWQKGAQQLTLEVRTAFANDPLNLLAVDGPTNQAKGDGDAATWLPPNKSFRCEYVARQVAVKAKYGLWVTAPESDAIIRVLGDCLDQPSLSDDDATVAPSVSATPAPGQSGTPQPAKLTAGPRSTTATSQAEPVPLATPLDTPAPQAPPPPVTTPEEPAADVYYKNCTEVREAGADPIHIGEPGYAKHLDGDGDGIGCE